MYEQLSGERKWGGVGGGGGRGCGVSLASGQGRGLFPHTIKSRCLYTRLVLTPTAYGSSILYVVYNVHTCTFGLEASPKLVGRPLKLTTQRHGRHPCLTCL